LSKTHINMLLLFFCIAQKFCVSKHAYLQLTWNLSFITVNSILWKCVTNEKITVILWKHACKIRWRLNCIESHDRLPRAKKRSWAYYYMGCSLWSKVYNMLWWAKNPMVILWPAHHARLGVKVTALLVSWATRSRTPSGC
jgi:hypothetical protein